MLATAGACGRPWNDHRQILNGIFWVLRTGAPWRDLPARYGSWNTVYGRFDRWSKDGTFDAIVEALQGELDAAGKVDRDLWCLDGSSVRATRAAAGASNQVPSHLRQSGRRACCRPEPRPSARHAALGTSHASRSDTSARSSASAASEPACGRQSLQLTRHTCMATAA